MSDTPRTRRSRTRAGEAGRPVSGETPRAATSAREPRRPSSEELDRRDKMKAGPRRQAGPPLEGDEPEAAPQSVLPQTVPPTDPKE